jgi:ketosteroid isomerase-like protein
MQAHDADMTAGFYAERLTYDDRRQLSGDPINSRAELRDAAGRILAQYTRFEGRTLAVRGERAQLSWSRWSDDDGNETTYLRLIEIDDGGRICYEGRFDGEDFESAYRELERRYYAGEGAAFAVSGTTLTDVIVATNKGELDRVFGELVDPEMRIENRSRSAFPDRSAAELRASMEELDAMVASVRTWYSAVRWLSPNWLVARQEREAVGLDAEKYQWVRLYVSEIRGGRCISICEFELDDEHAAFAYAEERMRTATSRLAVTNRSCDTAHAMNRAMKSHDTDGAMRCCSDGLVYDDRRRLSGDPIHGRAAFRAGLEQILAQYSRFEWRILAVRGDRLNLSWSRWSDDAGNETAYLHVFEIGDNGLHEYEGRFDEDDFEGAYRELERRYYAGEGAASAEAGMVQTEWLIALNRGDLDRVFSEFYIPGMRFEIRSRSAFPDRSGAELRASLEEFTAWVESWRAWPSAICWVSPTCCVMRNEREAVGRDGEQYTWTQIYVTEIRDGRGIASCEFEVEDEEAAFTYAEERMRATASRLAVTNGASQTMDVLASALQAQDIDTVVGCFSDRINYDDQRRLGGAPIGDVRSAVARIMVQYSYFEVYPLAVRGERLALLRSRWSDDSGNETNYLHVFELDDDGLIVYAGRFDEDDFDGAYRELDRRHYAGEGAAFAEAGATVTDYAIALNRSEFDRVFGELTGADFRLENRSRSGFGDRSAAELRATYEDLTAMVASARIWHSALRWLSPTLAVGRFERDAVGQDGEQYTWTLIDVAEIRDGQVSSTCQFELDDEDAAFAYAEERMRVVSSRLAVSNRASETVTAGWRAMQAHDIDALVALYADRFEYDDRRRLGGGPRDTPAALRAAVERLLEQYPHFEWRRLAVRGESLELDSSHWWDDAGNEAFHLHVFEIGDDGRVTYDGRFDEDDFEGAYRELERRYYAGEGAAYAAMGPATTEIVIATNRGDFDRLFDELILPDLQFEHRSLSGVQLQGSSATNLRAANEQLHAMVASVRVCISAVCWLSPTSLVARYDREAIGRDGERYEWTYLLVGEFRDGRLGSVGQFDIDNEERAFAYAEKLMRATPSRLEITNRASEITHAGFEALQARNIEAQLGVYSDQFVYDDRRRLNGHPIEGRAGLRAAMERIHEQYSTFEARTLAVRGERLHLAWSRWSNDAGFETAYLFVHEVDESGRIGYEGRFDEDNFEGAFRELEGRYYAGEGAAFAEAGEVQTDWITALNRGDLDRVGELYAPQMRVENRSRTGFPDRSASDLRATFTELNAMVASTRTWPSAVCWVSPAWNVTRLEREAVGADGERYEWTRLLVNEFRDGLVVFSCEFELEDEEQAFVYAEERVRATDGSD